MTTLAGYRITPAAQLESPHPRELMLFIEHKINMAPDIMEREDFMKELDATLRKQFGAHFSATLIDPTTDMKSDDWDDVSIIQVDALTQSTGVH